MLARTSYLEVIVRKPVRDACWPTKENSVESYTDADFEALEGAAFETCQILVQLKLR